MIRDLVSGFDANLDEPARLEVGIPGAISVATWLVKNANSTWFNGRPLRDDLETALGRSVRVENDANCLAVSEAVDGAGAGSEIVLAVIVRTGAGARVALNSSAVVGHQAIAGEVGHNPLPWMTGDEFPGNLY